MAEENNEIKKLIENLENRIQDLEKNPLILNPLNFGIHVHTGFDGSQKIKLFDITKIVLPGVTAAITTNFNHFYFAQQPMIVVDIRVIWSNAGGSGATLQVERLQGTETTGNGDDLMTGTINLTGTKDTENIGTLVGTNVVNLKAGDRLGLVDAGTLTALTDLIVMVKLQYA